MEEIENTSFRNMLDSSFTYNISEMHTAMPAVVVGVQNMDESRISVQPLILKRDESGEYTEHRPPIVNVVLQQPCTSLGGLTMPIQVNDQVLLIFTMRGLDLWKRSNGEFVSTMYPRIMAQEDAIAIAGVWPFPMSKNAKTSRKLTHSSEDVVVAHNLNSGREVEIRFKKSGDIVINSPTKITVNSSQAEVNADSVEVNSRDFDVNSYNVNFKCNNYSIATATYSMNATDYADSYGNISHNGSFRLNGTTVEDHTHSGVQTGGSRTNAFGS